jgi:hypothetical protein
MGSVAGGIVRDDICTFRQVSDFDVDVIISADPRREPRSER